MEFIIKSIEYGKNNNKKLILLTHHSPTKKNVMPEEFRGTFHEEKTYIDLTDNSYKLLLHSKNNIVFWGFGHTHYSSD